MQTAEILRLTNFYRVFVRIIETEHSLAPCLPLNGMYQFHVSGDVFEGRLNVVMFEIQEQISSAVGFFRL